MTTEVTRCTLTGSIVAVLPKPPTDNHYYTIARGRKILSKSGREYLNLVSLACRLGRLEPLTGRLAVQIEYHHHNRGRNDIANRLKALADALGRGSLYLDDSQIDDLRIVRRGIVPGGMVRVRIQEIAT